MQSKAPLFPKSDSKQKVRLFKSAKKNPPLTKTPKSVAKQADFVLKNMEASSGNA